MPAESGYAAFLRDLPPDWPSAPIAEVARVVGGGTPSRDVGQFWNGSIPWVTPGEISAETAIFLNDTREHISPAGLAGSGATLLPAGSLMITTRATLGARAINLVPMTTNQGFKSLVFPDSEDSQFFYYLTEKLKPELKRRASGTTFLEVSGGELARIRVPMPPKGERTQIAMVLDTLDATIRQTEAIIDKLKQVKQGLLHDLLTRGIADNGELRPPQSEAPHLYKESALGWIPKGWDAELLGLVLIGGTRNGLYKPSAHHGSGPLMVQMGGMFRGEAVDFQSATRVRVTKSELNVFGLEVGDLLFARRSLTFEGAGQCAIVRHLPELSTFESSIVRARVDRRRIAPEFGALFLGGASSSTHRRTLIRQVAVSGVSSDDIKHFLLALPCMTEQMAIIDALASGQHRIEQETAVSHKLSLQKSGLMDDLLTGRVRVGALQGAQN